MAIWTVYMSFCLLFALSSSATTTCDKDWTPHGLRCFKFFNTELSWIDAQNVCVKEGGNLASVHSSEENNFLNGLIKSGTSAWLGGNKAASKCTWLWKDDSEMDFTNWAPEEPNNYGGNEDCLQVYKNAKWNDYPCDKKIPFVCVKINFKSGAQTSCKF